MNTELAVSPKEFGIEETKAQELTGSLSQILSEREVLVLQYNEVIKMDIESPQTVKLATTLRKIIKDNRTKGIVVWHKTTKEFYLRAGQFIDAVKNKEIAVNERMEEHLEAIEKYAENKEKERKEALRVDRSTILQPYAEFVPISINLGELSQDEFDKVLNGAKLQFDAKVEAERKAEEARIENERKERVLRERHLELAKYAQFINLDELTIETTEEDYERLLNIALGNKAEHEAEQARIKAENERLKAEAEAKEKELQAEREKADAERKAAQEKLEKEQAEARRLAKELADKKAAEEKAEADRIAAAELELSKGDKEKFQDLINELELFKGKYSFKSKKYKELGKSVNELIDRTINYAISKQ